MTGMFLGWGETLPPAGTFIIWTMVIAAILTLALLTCNRHQIVIIAATMATAIGVPFLIDFGGAAVRGNPLVWQGRHGMALAVGIPIIAAFAIDYPALARRLNRVACTLGCLLALATALAFWSSLRRYTVGASGPLSFWVHPEWTPPVSPLLLAIVFPLLLGAVGAQQWRGILHSETQPHAETQPPPSPSA